MFIRSLPVVMLPVLLTACGAWQGISDTTSDAWHSVFSDHIRVLKVDLTAVDAVNPDETGRASPVTVRVYQLRARRLFDDASRADLLTDDRVVLAPDLLAQTSAGLNPGASVSLSQPMRDDTRYVAVVALYRDPAAGGWKRIVERKKLQADRPLKLTLAGDALVLQDDTPESRSLVR